MGLSSRAAATVGYPARVSMCPKLPALELLERQLEGIRNQRLVPVDPLVLVHGPVAVVRVDAKTVEGEQLDLLAGDVAEDVNGETTVPLTGNTHLKAERMLPASITFVPHVIQEELAVAAGEVGRPGLPGGLPSDQLVVADPQGRLRRGTSGSISSPSRTRASGVPIADSGATWSTTVP